jgi:mannose-6-phosphate isomerase
MPPLRLQPLYKQRPWGGKRLSKLWGRPSGNTTGWAESWEVVDLGADQSRVLGGPFDGQLLRELVRAYPEELLGRSAGVDQFPLLFKFLDAAETLSVQVHPNDEQAARMFDGQRGKSEAWVVLAAEPQSRLFVGLKSGVDRETLKFHLAEGSIAECLHSFPAHVGDVISVPAGTVHAIGAGVSLAEIQQPSDLTLRLFDWHRRDARGEPRSLHVEAALECIDFDLGPVQPLAPQPLKLEAPCCEVLLETEHFSWRRHRLPEGKHLLVGCDCCQILALISGRTNATGVSVTQDLQAGDCLLMPASSQPLLLNCLTESILLAARPT